MPIIDQYFQKLIELGGSDLHLSQNQPPKVRVHGSIKPISDQMLDERIMETMMREICEPRAWDRYKEKGDLDFAYEMDEDSRFRCNYLKQQNGLAAVFRLIPTEIASLDQAGPFYYAEPYHQQYLAKNPNGYCGIGGTGVSCPIGLTA